MQVECKSQVCNWVPCRKLLQELWKSISLDMPRHVLAAVDRRLMTVDRDNAVGTFGFY